MRHAVVYADWFFPFSHIRAKFRSLITASCSVTKYKGIFYALRLDRAMKGVQCARKIYSLMHLSFVRLVCGIVAADFTEKSVVLLDAEFSSNLQILTVYSF